MHKFNVHVFWGGMGGGDPVHCLCLQFMLAEYAMFLSFQAPFRALGYSYMIVLLLQEWIRVTEATKKAQEAKRSRKETQPMSTVMSKYLTYLYEYITD